jgi:DNA primase small subunit
VGDLIKQKFHEYYQNLAHAELFSPPSSIRNREFAFLTFGEALMLRHRAFDDAKQLHSFLAATTPRDAYYSAAYFRSPTAEMKKKAWLGADLVFDIDADHIPTSCRKSHDPGWFCEACLQSAKEETTKLLDMLRSDLGFSENEVLVYFSGHRGYHVHVESETIRQLDSPSRKEIVDYITGLGLRPELQHLFEENRIELGVSPFGWGNRIAKGIRTLLEKAESDGIELLGLGKKDIEILEKADLQEGLENKGAIIFKKREAGSWHRIVQCAAALTGARIDTVVSTDVHRLIRLPKTLHGKTGLMKVGSPVDKLTDFDPLKEAVAFDRGYMTLDVSHTPRFRVGEDTFGPFETAEHVELPTAAAVFLLCKGAAQVVE